MTRLTMGAAALGLAIAALAAPPAGAWNRGHTHLLTVVPEIRPGVQSVIEGLTVGPEDNVYVTTFGFNTQGAVTGNGVLFTISPNGRVLRQVTIANSSPHILGLGFNPVTQALWVLDFGAGEVLQVNPATGVSSILAGPIANSGLNALTFDSKGNGYVSDSFNGTIWQVPPNGGSYAPWASDPLLGPGTGLTPPFGANGVAFNNEHKALFVANTAFHQIIRIPVNSDGTAGTAAIFVTGINAPDGVIIDRDDNLWICANQEDEIVVVDPQGKVIAKLGDFDGLDEGGIPRGLLFPASLAFSNDGRSLYVSNLALNLPFAGAEPAIDSPWTLEVRGYTVSRLRAAIPPLPGPPDSIRH